MHGINKSLNKNERKGGNIKINSSQSDIKKIDNILRKLSNMKLTDYRSISEQNGSGIFTSILIPLIASAIPSLISGKGCCKKDNFFEKINNKSLYPISNFKINEILKNNKNYIGTFSKNNVPKLKNNQSAIVNLANSYDKGSHYISMKFINNKLFYFDSPLHAVGQGEHTDNPSGSTRFSLSFRRVTSEVATCENNLVDDVTAPEKPKRNVALVAGDSFPARLKSDLLGKGKKDIRNIAKGGRKIDQVREDICNSAILLNLTRNLGFQKFLYLLEQMTYGILKTVSVI